MADSKLLAILKDGVETWNLWRIDEPDIRPDLSSANVSDADLSRANLSGAILSEADLSEANLGGANLGGANLGGANLSRANFSRAELSEAELSRANLREANLSGANLCRAKLRGADLTGAVLTGAVLRGTVLSRATIVGTVFANTDLSEIIDLDHVKHFGPSSIGLDTFFHSKGKIPKSFLQGAGVPDVFIEYADSLAGIPFEFYSVFISYSTKDEAIAKRIYSDLQANGVRCWLFREDAKWGKPTWDEIDRGIKVHDKVLVICSENSLQSGPVLREIERALQREDKERKGILFPVRIDGYIFEKWEHHRKADVLSKVIGDMQNWTDYDAYQNAFNTLLRNLKSSPALM